jgi:pyridinium-3,5-biscarboxylic acid mononucleotide synthase
MDLKTVLEKLVSGTITLNAAEKQLKSDGIRHIGKSIANLDPHREARIGVPEVVLGSGKKYNDLLRIVDGILLDNDLVLVTKLSAQNLVKLRRAIRRRNMNSESGVNCTSLLITKKRYKWTRKSGRIGILCGGTSDIGIAEEARLMSKAMGCQALFDYDVGIAGIHRTVKAVKKMIESDVNVIVVVAGMEGALASVVSSLVDVPVVGVPTSVGYGFGSMGFAALASMLQSCSLGLAVVNINNGTGAGAFAARVAKSITKS